MPDRSFRAFVSYSHVDRGFAAALQRRLETYRLPRRLAGQGIALPGEASDRLGPIFRDRADLSAAEDLSQAVRSAIAASSALIVIASPDAAASTWVTREIELFRTLHAKAPIFVALIKGELKEAVPPVLFAGGAEPLAADFRAEGDGKRLAFLKIVAGLCELPLDALIQRDAQRQIRRVTAVTLSAVLLLAILSVALVLVWRAETKADRLRGEAEGIVTFMQSDLREPLRGTGNLKVMTAVNQRALDYFNAQGDPAGLSDDSQLLRALVLLALGEDQANDGKLDAAIPKFDDAYKSSAAVLTRRPNDPQALFVHAQSVFWQGYVGWEKNDRPMTARFWQEYAELAADLAAAEHDSVRSLMERGYAAGNLCELEHRHGDEARAAAHCGTAIDFETRAQARQAEQVRTASATHAGTEAARLRQIEEALANRHGWMAVVHLAGGNAEAALASRAREGALLDRLLAHDPTNVEHVLRRCWSDIGSAETLVRLARPNEAVPLLRSSLAKYEYLLLRSGGGQRVQEALLREYLLLARSLKDSGRPHAAELAEADRRKTALAGTSEAAAKRAAAIWKHIWQRG